MGLSRASGYGDTFAHVYDRWYGDMTDVEATVAALAKVAGGHRVLELGVGTGRIAIPLAASGLQVVGLDASLAMLGRCRAKSGAVEPTLVCADMACLPLVGTFDLVFVNFNTFFNLATQSAQRSCVERVAGLIGESGSFVVEAFVPSPEPADLEYHETERGDGEGGRVLTVSTRCPLEQTVTGVHIHTPAQGPVDRLAWTIRYLHPPQLDELCADAGLALTERWSDWTRAPFGPGSERHISLYTRAL